MMSYLSPKLQDFLSSPTPAGSGFHTWKLAAANKLAWAKVDYQDAYQILVECGHKAGRVDPVQIRYALDKAYRERANVPAGAFVPSDTPVYRAKPKWPERSQEAIAAVVQSGPGVYDLW